MVIMDPDLVHFACIAKGTTILAEFNSKDAALGAIAAECLDKTPSFHSTFTHTIRSMTYAFFIDKPFVYFAIFDDKLENSSGLAFLKNVRDAFLEIQKDQDMENLTSHYFQGDFNPVFHHLLEPGLGHTEGFDSPVGQRMSESGLLQSGPISVPHRSLSLARMKNRLIGEFKFGKRNSEKGDDADGGKGIGLSRDFSLVMHKNRELYPSELMEQQRAMKAWKKHVWWVLFLDLIICVTLFTVWLWVCRGFKCIKN